MSNKIFCKIAFIGLLVTFAHVTSGEICWDSKWYNSSSPADHGGSDNESLSTEVLKTICSDGSPVIDAHCRDEKGEPFRGSKNDTSSKYIANCTVATGLICHPYAGGLCADFAIQYGCTCPTTLPPNTIAPGGSSSKTTVNGGGGSTSGPGGSSSGIVSSTSAIRSSSTGIGPSPSGIVSSTSGIRSSSTGIGSSPSGIGSGSVSSGPGGSSIGNTNGEGLTGSGSSGQSVGNGSSGSPGGRNSSENGSNGSSAFGSCPCRNGSHKIYGSFYAVLLNVLLILRLF